MEKWVGTLDAAKRLGAQVVCPGHGPRGLVTVMNDQQLFFKQLRESVGALVQSKKTSREIYQSVPRIRQELTAQPQITRYIGKPEELAAQVEKVYHEMTGQNFTEDTKAWHAARLLHRHSHALQSS